MKNKIESGTVADLKNGFFYDSKIKIYSCLFCSAQYEDGDIYTFGERLVNAEKAIKLHISEKHGNVFTNLLAADKAQTGLTDTQKDFLRNYYSGIPDKAIAEKMNITTSTVRYQRYNFREKAKQAKIILALYELLGNQEKAINNSTKPVDENEKMLENLFDSFSPLLLKTYDFKKKKEEKRNLILKTILQQFNKDKKYTEKEINAILREIYHDYATIRRALIDYGFMGRTDDCREYWVK